jgi:hypothetical protein
LFPALPTPAKAADTTDGEILNAGAKTPAEYCAKTEEAGLTAMPNF